VALFMDGISMWLAYHIWSLCPTAGGQESSTRYIKLSSENLPDAAEIGIPEPLRDEWHAAMQSALDAYETALGFWEKVALENPAVTRIPRALLEDSSEKATKQVARMRRNYAFDRARYFLPAALKTNVMMTQSARAWVSLCQNLLSHPLPEAQNLGNAIREELALVAPRLIKHAAAQESFQKGILASLDFWHQDMGDEIEGQWASLKRAAASQAALEVFAPPHVKDFKTDLCFHDNRYAFTGENLQRTSVRFSWQAVAFADIRDLNRHRTGTKYCPLVPVGFYGAREQWDDGTLLNPLIASAGNINTRAGERLAAGDRMFVYWVLLGTQFSFEHTTTADKFIYEAELRTGVGAHYRYAKHLHDVLELWYQKFPETRGLILEGSAEPE
jgi:thymidylate synthase ThyX